MTSNSISLQEMTDDLEDYLDIPTLATPLKGEMPADMVFQNMQDTPSNSATHDEMKVSPSAEPTVSAPLSTPSNHAVLEYIQVMMQQADAAEKTAKEVLLYDKVVKSLMPSLKKELRLWLNTVLEEESRQLHKAVMQRFEADSDQLVGSLANIQDQVKTLLKQEEEQRK
jgi:hypothetical protein